MSYHSRIAQTVRSYRTGAARSIRIKTQFEKNAESDEIDGLYRTIWSKNDRTRKMKTWSASAGIVRALCITNFHKIKR